MRSADGVWRRQAHHLRDHQGHRPRDHHRAGEGEIANHDDDHAECDVGQSVVPHARVCVCVCSGSLSPESRAALGASVIRTSPCGRAD